MVLFFATSVLHSELRKPQRLSNFPLHLSAVCSISETLLGDFYGAFYTKAGRNPDPGPSSRRTEGQARGNRTLLTFLVTAGSR